MSLFFLMENDYHYLAKDRRTQNEMSLLSLPTHPDSPNWEKAVFNNTIPLQGIFKSPH